jgi:branched-chain amino acid transport system substrate-binding protein
LIAAGTSGVAKAVIEATKNDQIPVLTSTATATDLLDLGGAVFRVIPPNGAQAQSLAQYARSIGANTAGLIFQQDDYSTDLKDAFKRSFTAQGGKITAEAAFESEETAFRSQLDQLKRAKPAVILAAAQHVPMARILLRAREMGIAQPILAGETAFTDKLLAALGKTDPGRFYLTGAAVNLDSPAPNLGRFLQKFEAKNGKRPGIYGSYTYDAVGILTHALGTGSVKDRQHLISALRALKQYDGVTGPITFGVNGDVQRSYVVYTVRGGAFMREADGAASGGRQ